MARPLRIKKFNWTKKEQRELGKPKTSYAIVSGRGKREAIVKVSKTKAPLVKKMKELKKYSFYS